MKLLENEELQRMVDYSFGDHSGVLGGVPNAYMKKANMGNAEFLDKVLNHTGQIMTLFIDNIRLYRRPLSYSDWMHLKPISAQDRVWLNQFNDEDLLDLCAHFKKKFVIFTAFEDTPLDDYIWAKIPSNVIAINAANGVVFGDKVRPFPHGIERKMHHGYDHHEILAEYSYNIDGPKNLLFICHREDTGARGNLRDMFRDEDWATVAPKLDYEPYLQGIKDHKFVLCPSGNGIESARNWETLYMRRVPVFKKHPYLEEMFREFPALFVNDYNEVTEELLRDNDHLFQQAQTMDMEKLSLDYWFSKGLML